MSNSRKKRKMTEEESEKIGEELGLIRDVMTVSEPEEKKELVEKYYGGAVTFRELDQTRAASEKAREMSDLMYDFEMLTYNVIYSEEVDPEKKAPMVAALATELQDRVIAMKELKKDSIWKTAVEFVKQKFAKKEFKPMRIYKDADGQHRWVGVFTNNYLDKENDIISAEAHKEFATYLDANPQEAPQFWSWHTPGTARKERIDLWDFDEKTGFFIVGGALTDKEAEQLEKAIEYDKGLTGLSHGMYAMRGDSDPRVITKYRSFEISDLPLARAANGWTSLDIIKEAEIMKPETAERLKAAMGDEDFAAFETALDENKAVLDVLEVESKEIEPETIPETETVDEEKEKLDLKALSEFLVKQTEQIEAQAQEIENLKAVVSEQQKDIDTQVAEAIAPKTTPFIWEERPSQKEETLIDENDPVDAALLANKPNAKFAWVGEAMQ